MCVGALSSSLLILPALLLGGTSVGGQETLAPLVISSSAGASVSTVSSGTAHVAGGRASARMLVQQGHWYAAVAKANNERHWYAVVHLMAVFAADERARAAEQAARAARARLVVSAPAAPVTAPATDFGDLSGVVDCIKRHESGNYAESSHPGSGSGAYQFIPGTWQHWFAQWKASLSADAQAKIPYYELAYHAPPEIQDAVLHYTLTHGGAGNWSNKFGNDPCTQGMGG